MTPAVIVTRAEPGASETASLLVAQGYRAIVSPMLRIVPQPFDPGLLDGVRHLLFTSANGVRSFSASGASGAGLTAWCVGPSTAKAARAAGFGTVIDADGDAETLGRLILSAQPPPVPPLLHVANAAAAGNLAASLTAAGLATRFAAPYRAEPAPALSDAAQSALAGPAPVAILIHSAKAAEALAMSGTDLAAAALVGISPAALAPLSHRPRQTTAVAAAPNEAALMAALASVLQA